MSNHGTPGSANGRRDPVTRFAVVINSNVMRQIETRAALRESDLFSHTFSCESVETARDVLAHDGTEELSLIVLDASLADVCLPLMSSEQFARTILTHEPDVNVEYDLTAIPHPVSSSILLDVIGRLKWPDNRDQ